MLSGFFNLEWEKDMVYKFKDYKALPIMKKHLKLGGADLSGNRFDLNSLYLTYNDKPFIGIMGELHYERLPREDWKKALELMKEGGIEIVATYIIWIYHELNEGQVDWTNDNDLRAFIELAGEVGLKVCIRIGPWCHGEVRNGGFPDWLINKNIPFRENNPEYVTYITDWYSQIASQVQGLLFKDGGPVIMCQLENELTDNANHLLELKNIAKQVGIDVPYFTVTGWNAVNGAKIPVDEVIPTFGGYVDAPWDQGIEQLPPCPRYSFTGIRNDSAIGKDLIKAKEDSWQLPYEKYPYATCEIGAGLMDTYHRRYIIKGMDIYAMTLIMLCEGANLLGYYMYHGGINKLATDYTLQESKASGYPNDYPIISYDFQAPISSYNETRESYDLLNILHVFIKEYEDKLAKMTYVEGQLQASASDFKSLRYGMRTDGQSGFVFINHYQRLHEDVVIDTGSVIFPSINVSGPISFFMPFNMDMGDGVILEYATAQPICKTGSTWLFLEIPGIKPDFKFKDDYKTVAIMVLNIEEAKRLRKVDGKVFFADVLGKTTEEIAKKSKYYDMTPVDEPFEIPHNFKDELKYGGKSYQWYSLSVDKAEGFVNLDIEGDVMQLYVDGKLVEDDFYHGLPWRLPRKLIYEHEAYIVVSGHVDNIYIEGL